MAYYPVPQPAPQATYSGAHQPAYGQMAAPSVQPTPRQVAAKKPAAPASQVPSAPNYRVMKASIPPAAPAVQPALQADVPHTLRVSNPALNPYLNSALPMAPQVSTRCLAGMNVQSGYRSC